MTGASPADEPVAVLPYDPAWADWFEEVRTVVDAALAQVPHRVEHVGSTAVRGLAAKPILDVDVVVPGPAEVPAAIEGLAGVGYAHRGDLGVPGREAFAWPPGSRRHHLYVLVEGARELRRHLAFRDALRADPALAREYAALKLELARRHGGDREAYTEAKGAFVERALHAAGEPVAGTL